MARTFNDIVPPKKKRSIRDISVTKKANREKTEEPEADTPPDQTEHDSGRRTRTRLPWFARIGAWAFAALVLIVTGFGFFLLFSGATVTVEPRVESAVVDGSFTASRSPEATELPFERMEVSEVATKTVPASGTETVTESASGTLRIFNAYSESEQRFVANTRFMGPDGNIYRMQEPATIPGMTGDEPGTVEVTVYAAEAGTTYNKPDADVEFTVPGLSGTDLHDSIYARSVTAITGGFSGERPVVSESDEENARTALQEELREKLTQTVLGQVPDGYHIYENTIAFSYTAEPTESESESAVVRERASVFAPLIRISDLARFIARNTIATYDDGDVTLSDPADVTFTVDTASDTYPPAANTETFTFDLSGETNIVWTFDASRLADDLAGKSKGTLQTVLSGYPGIERAEIVIRPFWKQTFPAEPDDIRIRQQIPQ